MRGTVDWYTVEQYLHHGGRQSSNLVGDGADERAHNEIATGTIADEDDLLARPANLVRIVQRPRVRVQDLKILCGG